MITIDPEPLKDVCISVPVATWEAILHLIGSLENELAEEATRDRALTPYVINELTINIQTSFSRLRWLKDQYYAQAVELSEKQYYEQCESYGEF